MKKISNLIAISAVILVVCSFNTYGQSLKNRIWQCQDSTNIRTSPATLVFKSEGTYYQIESHLGDNMKIMSVGNRYEEGTYTETKTSFTLTQYIGERTLPPVTYKIVWTNSSEFILTIGINKYHFAELGSDADIFSLKYLIPYLKKELYNKHKIDPSYQDLAAQINAANDRLKEEAINNSKLIKKSSLVGTRWQMQMGKNKEERGRLKNISFDEDGTMREIVFNYANGSITGTAEEKRSAYREDAGNILVFNEKGTVSLPLDIKWESENQLMIERYYYARFNSEMDIFTKDYLINYTQSLIENARTVYPAYLEIFAGNHRKVAGKIYAYVGKDECEAPARKFEFQESFTCAVYVCNALLSDHHVDKNFRETSDCLYLNKRKLFSTSVKQTTWEEKYELKWLNSQEFTLIKDGKSYQYVFKGITPQPSVEGL